MSELIKPPDLSSTIPPFISFSLSHISQQIENIQHYFLNIFADRELRLRFASILMDLLKPKIIKLTNGEIKKLSENLMVEKTKDGKIILYEVTS